MAARRRHPVIRLGLLLALLLHVPAWAEQASVSMWAVQVTNEGRDVRFYDPGLEAVRETLGKVSGDTFRKLAVEKKTLEPDRLSSYRIDGNYTLHVKYLGKEEDGRIRLDI